LTFAGRIEAMMAVPTSTSVSVSNSGGGPTVSTLPAASYYPTACGTKSSIVTAFQSVLNSTRAATDAAPSWSVSLSTGASGDGRVTIDCTSGDRLVKSAATSAWDSGATSSTTLAGDGYVQFTATTTGKYRALGFSPGGTTSINFNTIGHGIDLKGGGTPTQFAVIELGTEIVTGTYASGDVFKVVRVGTTITYYQNGTLIYTSLAAASGNQVVDSAFFDTGGTIDGIRFFNNGVRTALTWATTGVTKSATTFSLAWTSTNLRDLLGFTADISSANSPQTGTKQARGLWRPDCPLSLAKSTTKMAPIITDRKTTIGPTGATYSHKGTKRYEQASAKWSLVEKQYIEESSATYANASLEQFLKDTQWGEGHSWFAVGSLIQIYDNAGYILGQDLNSGAGPDGWTWIDSDKFMAERTDQRGYDGLWSVEIPRLVSSG
jgi:hypothetical protein